jgi:hypothetical protein
VRAYERLWNFFISYVAVLSEPAQLNFYSDQYSLWKTARAIATGLSIISIEIVASISSSLWMNLYRGSSTLVLLERWDCSYVLLYIYLDSNFIVLYYFRYILTSLLHIVLLGICNSCQDREGDAGERLTVREEHAPSQPVLQLARSAPVEEAFPFKKPLLTLQLNTRPLLSYPYRAQANSLVTIRRYRPIGRTHRDGSAGSSFGSAASSGSSALPPRAAIGRQP